MKFQEYGSPKNRKAVNWVKSGLLQYGLNFLCALIRAIRCLSSSNFLLSSAISGNGLKEKRFNNSSTSTRFLSSAPLKYDGLTFFLRVLVLPGVEVHQLLPPLLPRLPLQGPLVGGLAVGAGLGALVASRDFHPALLVLLPLLSLLPLPLCLLRQKRSIRFLSRSDGDWRSCAAFTFSCRLS